MQKTTGRRQELECPAGGSRVTRRADIGGRFPVPVGTQLRDDVEPSDSVKIAKASRRFLDIRFQVENGVPVLVMTLAGHVNQIGQQGIAIPHEKLRNPVVMKFGE